MREILFRGKRADNEEWVYGYFGKNADGGYYISKTLSSNMRIVHSIIPETLGQFVEMEDTSGTKIFEGDKVEIITSNNVGDTCITRVTVSFDDLNALNAINYSHEIYVIGNIYDTPELLEER